MRSHTCTASLAALATLRPLLIQQVTQSGAQAPAVEGDKRGGAAGAQALEGAPIGTGERGRLTHCCTCKIQKRSQEVSEANKLQHGANVCATEAMSPSRCHFGMRDGARWAASAFSFSSFWLPFFSLELLCGCAGCLRLTSYICAAAWSNV